MSSTVVSHAFMRSLRGKLDEQEGFTLIEILVVIIIIGILAAIAIPIFLNQQRTARDSGVTSDVRNMATNTETGLVADPTASEFALYADKEAASPLAPNETKDLESLYLKVGDATPIEVSKTEGNLLDIEPGETPGSYVIMGWNEDGQEYKKENPLVYESAMGGILKDSERTSTEADTVSVNSSFEEGMEGWTPKYGDWTIDETEAHTGSNSMRVSESANPHYKYLDANIEGDHGYNVAYEGEKWRSTVWVKVEGEGDYRSQHGPGRINLGISYSNGSGHPATVKAPNPGEGWVKITSVRTISAYNDGTVVTPSLRIPDFPGGEFTFWFDDLTIEKVS